MVLLLIIAKFSFAQSITISDFDTIVMKQDGKIALSGAASRFVENKIPFYSFTGSSPDANGHICLMAQSFKNNNTKENPEITIRKIDSLKNLIYSELRYTAPQSIIQ